MTSWITQEAIDEIVARAVAAQREKDAQRCEQVATEFANEDERYICHQCAAAIRESK